MLQALPYYFDDIQRAIADMEPKHLILCGAVVPCEDHHADLLETFAPLWFG